MRYITLALAACQPQDINPELVGEVITNPETGKEVVVVDPPESKSFCVPGGLSTYQSAVSPRSNDSRTGVWVWDPEMSAQEIADNMEPLLEDQGISEYEFIIEGYSTQYRTIITSTPGLFIIGENLAYDGKCHGISF